MIQKTVAITMTCHNRVATTIQCLQNVFSHVDESAQIKVFLVDDGSTDGTAAAVRAQFPDVEVIPGSGSLFWNGGMHMAFGRAMEQGFDFYLWLNDDSFLYPDGLSAMLDTYERLARTRTPDTIVIGSMQDPDNGEFTYGGYEQVGRLHPLRLQLTPPGDEPKQCAAMCGNVVLISRSVTERIGNIEKGFLHRWGDVDYGLRAGKQGCEVFIAPGFVGSCAANPHADVWRDASMSIGKRFDALHDVKGVQKDDWLLFTRRHGGPLWFLVWLRPYLEVLSTHIMHRLRIFGRTATPRESG